MSETEMLGSYEMRDLENDELELIVEGRDPIYGRRIDSRTIELDVDGETITGRRMIFMCSGDREAMFYFAHRDGLCMINGYHFRDRCDCE